MAVKSPGRKFTLQLRAAAFPATLIVAAILAELFGEPGRELLRVEWSEIRAGELWRLWSGHVSHLGWSHLLLNAIGLTVVWVLVGDRLSTAQWWLLFFTTSALISMGLEFVSVDIGWYVGLSGVLHGLLVAGIGRSFRDRPWESAFLAAGLTAKLGWEQFAGPVPGSAASAGGPVIVDAHLYGSVAGLLMLGLFHYWDRPDRSV